MPEPLDPSKCEPGTKGFLPILSVYEFEGYGEDSPFDYFKEPDVELSEAGQWVRCCEVGVMGKEVLSSDTPVYATWQDAVQATIDSDRANFEAIIKEAQADLAQADKVQQWLNESEKAAK